jgi:hypothetical protein
MVAACSQVEAENWRIISVRFQRIVYVGCNVAYRFLRQYKKIYSCEFSIWKDLFDDQGYAFDVFLSELQLNYPMIH